MENNKPLICVSEMDFNNNSLVALKECLVLPCLYPQIFSGVGTFSSKVIVIILVTP